MSIHRDAKGFVAGNSFRGLVRFLKLSRFFVQVVQFRTVANMSGLCVASSMYDERCSTYESGSGAQLALRDGLTKGPSDVTSPVARPVRYQICADEVFGEDHWVPRKKPSRIVSTDWRAQFDKTNLSSVLPRSSRW